MMSADAETVRAISVAAGERFRSVRDPVVARCADDEPASAEELVGFVDAGRGWVAVEGGEVVGFLVAGVVDGCAHVEEVSVAPPHEGSGHGSALLETVAGWASGAGLAAVTLTTFRDVPWNRPFYERRGYRVLGEAELTPGLRRLRAEEDGRGLPSDVRVVMRRDL